MQRGDQINLQGQSSPIYGFYNKVPNGNFADGSGWSVGSNWSISGHSLLHGVGTSVTGAFSGALDLVVGKLYRFYCEVQVTNRNWVASTAYVVGNVVFYNAVLYQCTVANSDSSFNSAHWETVTGNNGIIVYVNNDAVQLPENTPLGQAYHSSFKVTGFYCPSTITSDQVGFWVNHPGITFKINNVGLVEFSTPVVTVYNPRNEPVYVLSPVIDYFAAPDYTTREDLIATTTWDMHLSLDALPDGCCYLVISDFQPIGDPAFQNNHYWTLNGWTLAHSNATTTNTSYVLTGVAQLIKGQTYTLNFNVQGLGTFVGLEVKINFGVGSPVVETIISNGQHAITFMAGGPTSGIDVDAVVTFNALYHVLGHTPSFAVSLGRVIFNTQGDTFTSNNISFQTAFPFPTLLFMATNNDNAFNFNYSNGLTHNLRLWAKMRYKDYKTQADEANFSDNSNVLMTAYLEKIYEVVVGDAAEFVHDCLSVMQINDSFEIGGATYIREGTYAVKHRKSTELAPAQFDVKPIQGISKNWNIE